MIEFLLTTDKILVPYLPTLINSIMAHHDQAKVHIITSKDVDSLDEIKKMFMEIPVEINHYISEYNAIVCQSVPCHVKNPAMFLRMFAPEILKDVKRVFYLDIDTIVNTNLELAFNTSTWTSGLAGVVDLFTPTIWKMLSRSFYNGPDVVLPDLDFVAFNSGVLIMDLEKMRENNSIDFMTNILSKSYMTDQPLMNLYAKGEFGQLEREFNVSANHMNRFDKYKQYGIIHWHGKKPWDEERPLQEYYNRYSFPKKK